MLQNLWKEKLGWDEAVPKNIYQDWEKFSNNLSFLKDFEVPRLVLCESPKDIQLHSFSDSSQVAFGASIYIRSTNEANQVSVKLLCSKSKVAPIKPTTIPRLELCAALLSARLSKAVLESLRYKPSRVVHWCDSSIVIAWINNNSAKLKAFVANRIFEINELTLPGSWRYVPTKANPADLMSRGVDARLLVTSSLWWNGPEFLSENESNWPILNNTAINDSELHLPEVKANPVVTAEPVIKIENYSRLNKLIRVVAYVKRFIHKLKNPKSKVLNQLTLEELDESFVFLSICSQRQSFSDEYDLLLRNKEIKSKSKILALSPFLDEKQVIRVGGRISAAAYSADWKHPILLHASHHLTKLFFEREHLRKMDAGPQLLLASVREVIWPVGGRRLARSTVNKCVLGRRHRGKTLVPKMGDLPSQRISPGFPFITVGIDFAGPFYILNRKGRGSKLIKCYLCLFVCLRYKCIHLEIVSDMSGNAFLMTLRRFIARRGKPKEIFCDNGNSHLTFEEITTLFAQIEAILNSRPLYPLSSSPNDLQALSPGHFIIGRPLTAVPGLNLEDRKEHSLKRHERIEKIRQHFWQRWQHEYVLELQQKTKWRTNATKLAVGDLVLLQEDNVLPLSWRLGRVVRLFPGSDGISRVADVNTTRGCVRRPLTRLCPLPTAEELC